MNATTLSPCSAVKGPAETRRAAHLPTPRKPPPRAVRTMEASEQGRPTDGGPLLPGDVFATVSGRTTTPWPRGPSDLAVDRWLAHNAAAEATHNGDRFNGRRYQVLHAGLLRPTKKERITLSPADRDDLNAYLWLWQPSSPQPLTLLPLVTNHGCV